MKYDFDAIIIGAGSGGLTSAIGLTKVGKKVLLVEKGLMGGDCTNFGCIPSKSLIHHAYEYATSLEIGGNTKELEKYRVGIFKKVRNLVTRIRNEESPALVEKHHGVHRVMKGAARLSGKHSVTVETTNGHKRFTARNIIIATGSRPVVINIPGLNDKDLLTNKTLFNLDDVPDNLLIIGGGAIGCEMAQAFSMLGSKVTVVTSGVHLLPRDEVKIAKLTEREFKKLGIEVLPHCEIESCEDNKARVKCKEDHKVCMKKIPYDKVLMAIGRVANTENIGLEKVGIKFDKYGIAVDDHYRTSVKNIFAVGDVAHGANFTHVADDQGRYVVKKILLPWLTFSEKKPLPAVTYLKEEVAHTGMLWHEAEKKYGCEEAMRIEIPFSSADRAKTDEAEIGLAIVIVKRISGKILGASFMGKNSGELIAPFTIAIQHGVSMWKINKTMFAYPVFGRLIKKLSDQFIGQTFSHLKNDLKHLAKKHFPKVVALSFWVTIFLLFSRYKTGNDLSSLDLARQLYQFVTGTTYGPFIYILVYALRPLIFFPATLLTLISGALFGFWWGIVYTIVGENMSANFAYFLGRLFGKDLIPADGMGLLSKWKNKLCDNSFVSVLIMRFAYVPFDLTNYGCGILNVKWFPYFLATLIGIMPGLITFVSFGASIENIADFDPSTISIDPLQLFISLVLFVVSLAIAKLVQCRQRVRAS